MLADIEKEGMESRVAPITVDRPEPGETLTIEVVPGLRVVLEFNPAAAKFEVAGDDFVLTLEDGGQIVFAGLVTAAQGANAPTIQIAGIDIGADVLMEQVLALTEQTQAEPIETAAGEVGEGDEAAESGSGGSSGYDDSFGELISGLTEQGTIGETELGFGLIADGNSELPVDTAFLSESPASSGGGTDPLAAGSSSETPSESSVPEVADDPEPSTPPVSDSVSDEDGDSDEDGGDDSGDGIESLEANDMNIITNEANGNLHIPHELILYLADPDMELGVYLADSDAELSITGPGHDGAADNAHVWSVPGVALSGADSFNTWTDNADDYIRFHIDGKGPLYQGSFSYEAADGEGGTGSGTIGVVSVETENDHGYWTLKGTDADEVLLGLDGRNQIDGGGGDDIIHGGHDASGDILMGGDGDDVIFGGSGNDDLQGGDGDDTFIMRDGFGRDGVDGGVGDSDTITLDGVLTGADVASEAAVDGWLTLTSGSVIDADTTDGRIELSADAAGIIDLGGGNEITFINIEQIDYALVG